MTDSQEELREAQARIKELEQQNRMLELKSKLYTQERKMLSANVAVGVVNAFRDTARKEDIKVREALEEAVVDWLAKHDALDGIDLKAGAHNKVADDKANEDKDTEDNTGEDTKGVDEEAEGAESDTGFTHESGTDEGNVDEGNAAAESDDTVEEFNAKLAMPRPDYNL